MNVTTDENLMTNNKLVIIGGGPAGYPAAFRAADMGMDVTLIDMAENPGGVCLYRGCIPSKALLHVAKIIEESREAKAIGITFNEPEIDLDRVRSWKESVVKRLTSGLGQLRSARAIHFIRGRARFLDASSVTVEKEDGQEETIKFDKAIIATGSRPISIPLFDIGSPRVMDSTGALELPDIPESLLVVGGGYIGLELGSVYAALGSRVEVVEMLPGIIPGADRDLVKPLEKRLQSTFSGIMVNTKVTGLKEVGEAIEVTFEDAKGESFIQTYGRVLVSIGRKPNTENIGLEHTDIKVLKGGFIEVDGQRRTAESNIYAIGDVSGQPMLAHKGTHEGLVAIDAIAGRKTVFEPAAIPAVMFTDPEIAWCGLTEIEAKERGIDVKVAKFPWSASGRAMTLERMEGLTKLIIDPETDRLLGAGLVGVGVGDMIAECTQAIEMGATAEDLALTIHPHPTLSETIMEAAEVYYGHCTHMA